MSEFERLLKLKKDMEIMLESLCFVYHGGSILGDEMKAILHISRGNDHYRVVIDKPSADNKQGEK